MVLFDLVVLLSSHHESGLTNTVSRGQLRPETHFMASWSFFRNRFFHDRLNMSLAQKSSLGVFLHCWQSVRQHPHRVPLRRSSWHHGLPFRNRFFHDWVWVMLLAHLNERGLKLLWPLASFYTAGNFSFNIHIACHHVEASWHHGLSFEIIFSSHVIGSSQRAWIQERSSPLSSFYTAGNLFFNIHIACYHVEARTGFCIKSWKFYVYHTDC